MEKLFGLRAHSVTCSLHLIFDALLARIIKPIKRAKVGQAQKRELDCTYSVHIYCYPTVTDSRNVFTNFLETPKYQVPHNSLQRLCSC